MTGSLLLLRGAAVLAVSVFFGACGAASAAQPDQTHITGDGPDGPAGPAARAADFILLADSSDRGTSLFDQRRKARYAQPSSRRAARPVARRSTPKTRTVKAPAPSSVVAAQPAVQSLGGYRTMCVRSCDGYYFPISPSSSKGEFKRDQENCQTMCPGAEVQLYYQDASEQTPETMRSLATDKPYSELPAAFLYRDVSAARPAQCECNPNRSFVVMAPDEPAGGFSSIETLPETATQTSTEGSITTLGTIDPTRSAAIGPAGPKEPPTELPPAGSRKVRVVGPVFLPDPEGAIDLRAPAQNSVQ